MISGEQLRVAKTRVRLLIDKMMLDSDFPDVKAGTLGEVRHIYRSEFADVEDYIGVLFDGMSYYVYVPASHLEIA